MKFLNSNGLVIHYDWINNKKERTFLFINPLGTDFRIWEEVVELLNEHANILLFDNRGHGLTDIAAGTRGLKNFADDTEALMNHLQIGRCVLIGLSIGGMIALILASRIPGKIEKLVLCDTGQKIGDTQTWSERIKMVNENGLRAVSGGIMQRWFSEAFRNRETAKVTGYTNMLERTPVPGYINACEAIRDADLTSLARQIRIPALCIVGEEDQSTTPGQVKNLADLIKGSTYEVIPGSGHIPCVDNPVALSKLIIDFIKK